MKVIEIAFSSYPVTDLKRAREFYEGTLGLVIASRFGDDSRGFIEYEIAGATLAIGNGAEMFKPSRDGGIVTLEVENFDEAVARLQERGVAFIFPPKETPACRMVGISDPDGNSLLIHKRK